MTEAIISLPAGTARQDVSWKLAGSCRQVDPDLFFPEKGGSTKDAKRICATCPVRAECLEFALENGEQWGVWGGLSQQERSRLKRLRHASLQLAS